MTARTPIIVFGGSGFVGQHLVPALVQAGHRVVIPTRGDGSADATPHVKRRSGDVYDPAFLREVLRGAHAVINLVGILNEKGDDGLGFQRVFVELPDLIMAAMHDTGVRRLLQMSALHADDGQSNYLKARGRAERHVRKSPLDWTLFRASVIAGPGDGLFNRFDQLLKLAPALPVGRADARFQPVWVGDVAQAFVTALQDAAAIGQTYDLAGPRVLTLREIIQHTARARGRHRGVIALPDALGQLQASIGEYLPGKPISRDNWRSLQQDSTSQDDGLAKLGITRIDPIERLPEILGLASAK